MNLSYTLAFIAGLVSFLSPCVLPLVPAYIGYMGGRITHTVAAQSGTVVLQKTSLGARFGTLIHSLVFVLGFAVVFVSLGLLGTAFVSVIGRQNLSLVTGVISRAGGVLIIFFGLHFMGVLSSVFNRLLARPTLLNSPLIAVALAAFSAILMTWIFEDWLPALPAIAFLLLWFFTAGAFSQPQQFWTSVIQSLQARMYADTRRQMIAQGNQGYLSSFAMGVIFSAGWTPCIGPIYGSILTLAASGGDVNQAGLLLTAYSLGLGIPFILAAILLDGAQGILRRLQRHLHTIELVSGAFLVAMGVLVASGNLQSISQNFANQFADFSYRLENCTISLFEGEIMVGDFSACFNAPTASAASAPAEESLALADPPSILDLSSTLPTPDGESSSLEALAADTILGTPAPAFTTVNDAGDPVTLEDYRGQVVLLNFWATWCGPCRIEMPAFEAAYARYGEDGLVIVGVNNQETVEDVTGFRLEQALSFPLLMDETGAIQRAYGVRSYPSTFLINRDGAIIAQHFGALTTDQIGVLIDDALAS